MRCGRTSPRPAARPGAQRCSCPEVYLRLDRKSTSSLNFCGSVFWRLVNGGIGGGGVGGGVEARPGARRGAGGGADVREGRPRPGVAVLADLVAAEAAGGRG